MDHSDIIINELAKGNINKFICGTPLIIACRNENYELAEDLIKKGANVNESVITFVSYWIYEDVDALSLMVCLGKKSMVELLLKHGANPSQIIRNPYEYDMGKNDDVYSPDEKSLLMTSIKDDRLDIAELLITYGARLDDELDFAHIDYDESEIGIITTIENENIDFLDLLLQYSNNVNFIYNGYTTPLMTAIRLGRLDIIDRLLVNGANVNCILGNNEIKCLNPTGDRYEVNNFYFDTPIGLAVEHGNFDICKRILDMGVNLDLDLKNKDFSHTSNAFIIDVYIRLLQSNLINLFYLLLEYPCDLNIVDPKYNTLLSTAIVQLDIETIKILLDKGVDPNISPLNFIYTLAVNNFDIIKLVLDHGMVPFVNSDTIEILNALDNDIIDLLVDYGLNLDDIKSYQEDKND